MVLNPRSEIWKYFDNIVEEGVAVCKLCNQRLKNERSFSLKKHITQLHNPKSEIWKFFDNIVSDGVAVCRICAKRVRNNRHFNLILHLKQHEIVIEREQQPIKTSNLLKDTEDALPDSNKQNKTQIKDNVYIKMDKKTLTEAVMGLMIDEGVAPKLFASKNMQELLSPITDAISKEDLKKFTIDDVESEKMINLVAQHIREGFIKDLKGRLLSLKIDMDLNCESKIFFLSAQYVEEEQVNSRLLGGITLEAEQEQLSAESILNLLKKFDIESQQIVSAYWDISKAKYKQAIANSQYLQEIKAYENTCNIHVGEVKLERYVGVIVQLCIFDIFKHPKIFQLFLECRNLIKFINDQPQLFEELLKKHQLKATIPQLDSPWQWGSTYKMMNDLKELLPALDNLKLKQPVPLTDGFNFNNNLKNFIESFCKTLNFIEKAAQKFYTTEIIYGDYYAQWLKCKLATKHLCNVNKTKENTLNLISCELLKSIENRSDELLNQDHFKACLYLDPRFQHTLNMPEKMFAMEYLRQLWERSKLYNPELVDPVTEVKTETQMQTQNFDDDDDDAVLNEFLFQTVQESTSTGIYKKLEDLKLPFKNVDTNILTYWQGLKDSQPEIYILSQICFAIPATQNYNKIFCSHHNSSNVSPSCKENLDLLRLNPHLLNEAMEKLELSGSSANLSDVQVSSPSPSTSNSTA